MVLWVTHFSSPNLFWETVPLNLKSVGLGSSSWGGAQIHYKPPSRKVEGAQPPLAPPPPPVPTPLVQAYKQIHIWLPAMPETHGGLNLKFGPPCPKMSSTPITIQNCCTKLNICSFESPWRDKQTLRQQNALFKILFWIFSGRGRPSRPFCFSSVFFSSKYC